MFQNLEERFNTLQVKISKKIDRLSAEDVTLEEKAGEIKIIEDGISKMQTILRQLDVETRTKSNSIYTDESEDLEAQKAKLQLETGNLMAVSEKFKVLKEKIERLQLIGNRQAHVNEQNNDFLENIGNDLIQDRLFSQNETLSKAKQRLLETEAVASSVTENLYSNREKISSALGKSNTTSYLIGTSSTVLDGMLLRENRRKLILRGVGIFLGIVFLLLLFQLL